MIKKIDHLTINVKSLEKTIRFYHDVLAMPMGKIIDMGDHSLTYLKMTDNFELELISYCEDVGVFKGSCMQKGMLRHLAFEVDDIRALEEKLKKEECHFNMEVTYVEKLKSYRMLVEDPNGIELEFIENSKEKLVC